MSTKHISVLKNSHDKSTSLFVCGHLIVSGGYEESELFNLGVQFLRWNYPDLWAKEHEQNQSVISIPDTPKFRQDALQLLTPNYLAKLQSIFENETLPADITGQDIRDLIRALST